MSNHDVSALGGYLRRRRELMAAPSVVDTAYRGRRRVPGLRRQELAERAGISVEYYIRLEQSRASRPSRQVLGALSTALELSDRERDHLYRLAGERAPGPPAPDPTIRPGLLRLLRGLDDTMPVTVFDGRLDVLAYNAAAAELYGPPSGEGRFDRNLVHRAFRDAEMREILGAGVEQLARYGAAELRSAMSRYPGDEYLEALLDELSRTSAPFREHWERNEVGVERSSVKWVRHRTRGWLSFDVETLHDEERDHWVMLYTPRPADPASPDPSR